MLTAAEERTLRYLDEVSRGAPRIPSDDPDADQAFESLVAAGRAVVARIEAGPVYKSGGRSYREVLYLHDITAAGRLALRCYEAAKRAGCAA